MIILGIDPGTARVGWGVIDIRQGTIIASAYGCITTEKSLEAAERLVLIHEAITTLLTRYVPEAVSVEELFFSNNAKTAIAVGQAQGVVLLAAAQHHVPVVSYTPLVVKQTVCGSGTAEKSQVQKMVTRLLRLTTIPKPDDTADALAIALTHAYSYKLKKKLS